MSRVGLKKEVGEMFQESGGVVSARMRGLECRNSTELGFRASEGWFRGRQEVVIQTVVG